jgi:putative transposase
MPKKQHTEEQIISALKQHEGGEKTADVCRKLGVSQATFYMWKEAVCGARGARASRVAQPARRERAAEVDRS